MMNHYYSRNPETESNPVYWEFRLRGQTFGFKTDQGVFSKKEVDFGSRFLIDVFDMPDITGPILDVGCGYGPIGLAIAKMSVNRTVHMIDVNQRALNLATENAKSNSITNVEIYESDRFENVKETEFAAIVTNPPIRAGKNVVHDILTNSYKHLKAGGELWVVIQKKQGAPSAKAKLEEIFEEVEVVGKNKGYYILKAKKLDE
ncbi:16S rRNA methyltransferase [Heyndrickxia sporothermodurans]|uniref:Class I SAM-dependent methyltransferase n=1 Tax=Heyndrickxia sporothermodurans TaxID=46224 RepID=A0AB37HG17_9BACI|nr:class I SAM-dependent methyltransferase [Heyndrickxia sporothermodurans]MBL5766539.1 class I SAM-dependent methyltransferase [Heyndrickxia sporothermodurans]MBL5769950.1 class I SAM-dependent methyltransferase [Heyndrickxia sporothermodurans]MBL5773627.1 class I SAM-dependent methyltransferase [Heyndrickxia sporothermodurans]MBL5777228.1 class I SAM-dependent methyltransferase [Heyndrickxia sporothermodurans]MBL5780617.1 class I SAM-dependent methyltransferase [Heyndrickxia sporothermoduran